MPLALTPLGMLLADHVSLSGDVTVTGLQRLPGQIQVTLVRTASPQDGTLTLVFADNPLALRQWTVLDAQRRETRVTLYNVEQGVSLDPNLFEFVDPRNFQTAAAGLEPIPTRAGPPRVSLMPANARNSFIFPSRS